MSTKIGKAKQALLDRLPPSLAMNLYLLRNGAFFAKGKVYKNLEIGLFVPKRNQIWKDRMHSGEGHEIGICEFLEEEVKNNADYIYCDVGSCFGFFPAFLSELKPNIQIVAFEAGWQQFHFLKKNREQYKLKNDWKIVHKYVGAVSNDQFVQLDEYFKKLGSPPDLIQIDVDGFENEVLKGCAEIIQQKKTKFLLELHPLILDQYKTSTEEVLAHFEGYDITILADIRNGNTSWSKDMSLIHTDDNPYLLICPK